MEYQLLFNAALGLVAFFGGWTLNSITKTIERLDVDVRNLPHNYVAKDDYRSDIKDVKLMLSKIFERLDNKADK
tara:strand:+ start:26 stop:247 length:222 start_codon:yes stop_codon:yes gene_type:complete